MFDFWFFFNNILIGIGLAMDAFSVSLANGLSEPCMTRRKMTLIAGTFAFFQGLMPFIGWVCVHTVASAFSAFSTFIPWIALLLLGFIGGKMLFEGIREERCIKRGEREDCPCVKRLGITALLVQGIATSIDALSVGFTISDYEIAEALLGVLIIALVTFFICMLGIYLGKKFGTVFAGKSAILGGSILIAIGIEIFVTSFF